MANEIKATPLAWFHPMPNAWAARVFKSVLQIVNFNCDFFVIVPSEFGGGGISTAATKLEDEVFTNLTDAQKATQRFMDLMVREVAYAVNPTPEGKAE